MNNKRSLIITALATFCLTATIFMILPTQSEYDPWLDYNEDGYIGIDDIYATAQEFGAEGDPTKNVNVTNWEDCLLGTERDYAFFNYKCGWQPIVYVSPTDTNEFFTTSTTPVTVQTFIINGLDFDSSLSTEALFSFYYKVWAGNCRIDVYLVINGVQHCVLQYNWGQQWSTLIDTASFALNTSKTDNEILVQIASEFGNPVGIGYFFYHIQYNYSKRVLTAEDFGFQKSYLKSVTLSTEETIRLDADPNQIITNPGVSPWTYEFAERIRFNSIEFVSGNASITVLATDD